VLLRRQHDGLLPVFPIWDDVRTFDGRPWRGLVDVITAGFPCQPFSVAGQRRGSNDERNLWPETIRVIRAVRPRYAFLENVPGLLTWNGGRYFGRIFGDLAESGFDAEWTVLGASDIGAPHYRKRLWILAYTRCGSPQENKPLRFSERLDTTDSRSRSCDRLFEQPWRIDPADEPQSSMGRVAHGVAYRVDRLRALGNGQVPLVAATAWQILMGRLVADPRQPDAGG
jgi:DNA (cytosine-5)-methyltransferase 1